MTASKAYDEIIDFIASGNETVKISEFVPSQESKNRVLRLVERSKQGVLTEDEDAELRNYLQLEHIMRLVKARAKELLTGHATSYSLL